MRVWSGIHKFWMSSIPNAELNEFPHLYSIEFINPLIIEKFRGCSCAFGKGFQHSIEVMRVLIKLKTTGIFNILRPLQFIWWDIKTCVQSCTTTISQKLYLAIYFFLILNHLYVLNPINDYNTIILQNSTFRGERLSIHSELVFINENVMI